MSNSASFPPPVEPSTLPGTNYPALTEFLRRQVDMQIADVRLLFRLPVPELDPNVGCNLTTAAMMLNLISGFSVWFFETEKAVEIRTLNQKDGGRRSKARFIGFVEQYWPQLPPEPSPSLVAERLYEVRNSLAHDLGVYDDPGRKEPGIIQLGKHALSFDEIIWLERSSSHPLTVPVIEGEATKYTVHLSGLYWALHRMLRAALSDRPGETESAIAAVALAEIEELTD